jgi:nucleoid-associated protein YgaU
MNVTGKFLLVFLCLSIISYGLSGSVYASNHNVLPLTVQTNTDSYAAGDTILIFGSIRDYDGKYPDVTIQIFGPLGGLKMIKQLAVSSDGTFSFTAIAAGTINLTGEYIVKAMWNKQPAEAMFEFVGGAAPEPVNEAAEAAAAAAAAAAEAAAAAAAAAAAEAEAAAAAAVTTAAAAAAAAAEAAAAVVIEAEPEIEPEPMMASEQVEEKKKGGGCLIATAAFGSEMAPQVQFLREIRDNKVLQTESGSAFMTGFNQFYYSFSPVVADYERENPAFKETVKLALTPMLTSLAILNYVDIDSEAEMLGYGIGIILLNIGMYFVAPAIIIIKIKNRN